MNDQALRTSLLDFLNAVGPSAGGILLAGGYGMYLKQLHALQLGRRTLLDAELWPTPRGTEDLDVLLEAQVVADVNAMTDIRSALDRLGYVVVEQSKYLQFVRPLSQSRFVKIDLLTAQLDQLLGDPRIKADSRRARPSAASAPSLHAHPTDGALAMSESPERLPLIGTLSDGRQAAMEVRVPHPFTYLLMKLTAYRDRSQIDDPVAAHHALDLFRILAMMTEDEYEQTRERATRFSSNPQVRSCDELLRSDFAGPNSSGILAMRTHPLWRNDAKLEQVIDVLSVLLTP